MSGDTAVHGCAGLRLAGDGLSLRLGAGAGVLSSSPAGGYSRPGTIGIGASGDLSLPLYAPASSVAVAEETRGRTSVTAVAVADLGSGILRAGHRGQGGGGVTLVVMLGCDTPVSTLARAAVTAAEAVTCVIQDMDLRDPSGRAGSGVSNLSVAMVHDTGSDLFLRGAGKHSLLGELIGRTVHRAVAESADRNGTDPGSVPPLLWRLAVRGASSDLLFELSGSDDRGAFDRGLSAVAGDDGALALASSVMQLDDEMAWGLLPAEAAVGVAGRVLSAIHDVGPEASPLLMLARSIALRARDLGGGRRNAIPQGVTQMFDGMWTPNRIGGRAAP